MTKSLQKFAIQAAYKEKNFIAYTRHHVGAQYLPV